MLKRRELGHKKMKKMKMEEVIKDFRVLLQEEKNHPPPLTPSLFNITLKYSVPEDRGEPGSLNTSTAELPQSAGPCEEMQLYLK